MSDEGEIDVESDEVGEGADGFDDGTDPSGKGVDKRAHHNALERKRRDHIKDSFTNLRDCIPSLSGEKVSRAHVLNKATEYIRQMQRNSSVRTVEIDELRKKNEILEEQVNGLEHAQEHGALTSPEELIASIAEKVQQRQLVRQQQDGNTTKANKIQLEPSSNESNTKETKSTESSNEQQPNSFNILANNIRTTQNILSALAKNLPANSTNSQQMRAIAARVLASPVRPQGATPTPLPRGVVTATTVPQLTEQQLPKTKSPIASTDLTINSIVTTPTIETSVSSQLTTPSVESLTVINTENGNNAMIDDQLPPSKRIRTTSS